MNDRNTEMKKIINKLMEIWYTYPGLRFGQLISNIEALVLQESGVSDLYCLPDDKFLEALNAFQKKMESAVGTED